MRKCAGIRLGRCSAVPKNDPDFGMNEEEVARFWCEKSGIAYLGRAEIGHDATIWWCRSPEGRQLLLPARGGKHLAPHANSFRAPQWHARCSPSGLIARSWSEGRVKSGQQETPLFLTLDGMRGIGAILVVWGHTMIFWGGPVTTLPPIPFCVDLFFILSGYVIGFAYEPRLADGDDGDDLPAPAPDPALSALPARAAGGACRRSAWPRSATRRR